MWSRSWSAGAADRVGVRGKAPAGTLASLLLIGGLATAFTALARLTGLD
jgi:hypothetical protein